MQNAISRLMRSDDMQEAFNELAVIRIAF